jgi:hypothetical protein
MALFGDQGWSLSGHKAPVQAIEAARPSALVASSANPAMVLAKIGGEEEMAFDNLVVQRVVLHEVYRRRDNNDAIQPRYGDQLIRLPLEAMEMFKERVVDAMGTESQSMEVEIVDASTGGAVEISASLLGKTDGAFITESRKFADRLTQIQVQRNLPGGVLVVFSGTVFASSLPFVAVIKAEKQTGFHERGLSIQFLKDLFLTPASKLYKIGFFIRDGDARLALPDGWKAFVYDSHMSSTKREGAAKYFYDLFLGCKIPQNSAYLTRSFFEHTREFIRALPVEPEMKDDFATRPLALTVSIVMNSWNDSGRRSELDIPGELYAALPQPVSGGSASPA